MLRDGRPFFLDYQGGRKGALQYDIASLLYDAKADLPPELRQQLLDRYIDGLADFIDLKREVFMHHYYAYVYIRIMQALGAYGFRGFYERQSHFLQSVPYALKNLRWLLQYVELPVALPTLMKAFTSIVGSERLLSLASKDEKLIVRIFSFSFRQGIPKDEAGHGGGFVFDARSIPNPGREERFKTVTGKDDSVIDYLNQQESVHQFLAGVMSLVDASIERLSASRFYEPDGVVWLHGRPASLRLLRGATGETFEGEKRCGGGGPTSRAGEYEQVKAMILAAGLGTRLRPLTDNRPKALVEVAGRTMLEITLSRLRAFDIREVIINVHHFADMILDYLKANNNFGMHIEVSREDVLLDTGGGLKKTAYFFTKTSDNFETPFLLHNVDVVSTIDFRRMVQFHIENKALVTLAVQDRETSRYLLFDEQLQLCGRRSGQEQKDEPVRSSQPMQTLAFSGIHIISPRLFAMMIEEGTFPIITSYLRLAACGEKIIAFRADEYYWRDLGRPDNVAQAALDLKKQILL